MSFQPRSILEYTSPRAKALGEVQIPLDLGWKPHFPPKLFMLKYSSYQCRGTIKAVSQYILFFHSQNVARTLLKEDILDTKTFYLY